MNVDKEKLKQYLLGTLPEAEFAEVDLRIIEDAEFSSELSLAENDLVEDFLENSLSETEVQHFQANFLCSPERRLLLKEVAGLKKFAMRAKADSERPVEKASTAGSFWSSIMRPIVLAPAFGALILVGFLAWQMFFVTPLSPLEREYAELNKQDFADLTVVKDNSSVSLMPVNLRDGGPANKKRSNDLTDKVFFRLGLPAGEKNGSRYDIKLLRGSLNTFVIGQAPSYPNQGGMELRLLLPKSALTAGQYQFRVENPSMGSPAIYPFTIE